MSSFASANSTANTSTGTPAAGGASSADNYRLPEETTMQHAMKMAIKEDRPILMDYWIASIGPAEGKPFIGIRQSGEKLLVKNDEEYTSPIGRIFKSKGEYIIMTENSIYVVCASISNKRIA